MAPNSLQEAGSGRESGMAGESRELLGGQRQGGGREEQLWVQHAPQGALWRGLTGPEAPGLGLQLFPPPGTLVGPGLTTPISCPRLEPAFPRGMTQELGVSLGRVSLELVPWVSTGRRQAVGGAVGVAPPRRPRPCRSSHRLRLTPAAGSNAGLLPLTVGPTGLLILGRQP